ncbi:unnamed protein product [Amoebophrya sp. A120]|nr:unnamed protein product [Amoebophrya sp. A120]|eukprot:GSA120T00022418001.1
MGIVQQAEDPPPCARNNDDRGLHASSVGASSSSSLRQEPDSSRLDANFQNLVRIKNEVLRKLWDRGDFVDIRNEIRDELQDEQLGIKISSGRGTIGQQQGGADKNLAGRASGSTSSSSSSTSSTEALIAAAQHPNLHQVAFISNDHIHDRPPTSMLEGVVMGHAGGDLHGQQLDVQQSPTLTSGPLSTSRAPATSPRGAPVPLAGGASGSSTFAAVPRIFNVDRGGAEVVPAPPLSSTPRLVRVQAATSSGAAASGNIEELLRQRLVAEQLLGVGQRPSRTARPNVGKNPTAVIARPRRATEQESPPPVLKIPEMMVLPSCGQERTCRGTNNHREQRRVLSDVQHQSGRQQGSASMSNLQRDLQQRKRDYKSSAKRRQGPRRQLGHAAAATPDGDHGITSREQGARLADGQHGSYSFPERMSQMWKFMMTPRGTTTSEQQGGEQVETRKRKQKIKTRKSAASSTLNNTRSRRGTTQEEELEHQRRRGPLTLEDLYSEKEKKLLTILDGIMQEKPEEREIPEEAAVDHDEQEYDEDGRAQQSSSGRIPRSEVDTSEEHEPEKIYLKKTRLRKKTPAQRTNFPQQVPDPTLPKFVDVTVHGVGCFALISNRGVLLFSKTRILAGLLVSRERYDNVERRSGEHAPPSSSSSSSSPQLCSASWCPDPRQWFSPCEDVDTDEQAGHLPERRGEDERGGPRRARQQGTTSSRSSTSRTMSGHLHQGCSSCSGGAPAFSCATAASALLPPTWWQVMSGLIWASSGSGDKKSWRRGTQDVEVLPSEHQAALGTSGGSSGGCTTDTSTISGAVAAGGSSACCGAAGGPPSVDGKLAESLLRMRIRDPSMSSSRRADPLLHSQEPEEEQHVAPLALAGSSSSRGPREASYLSTSGQLLEELPASVDVEAQDDEEHEESIYTASRGGSSSNTTSTTSCHHCAQILSQSTSRRRDGGEDDNSEFINFGRRGGFQPSSSSSLYPYGTICMLRELQQGVFASEKRFTTANARHSSHDTTTRTCRTTTIPIEEYVAFPLFDEDDTRSMSGSGKITTGAGPSKTRTTAEQMLDGTGPQEEEDQDLFSTDPGTSRSGLAALSTTTAGSGTGLLRESESSRDLLQDHRGNKAELLISRNLFNRLRDERGLFGFRMRAGHDQTGTTSKPEMEDFSVEEINVAFLASLWKENYFDSRIVG